MYVDGLFLFDLPLHLILNFYEDDSMKINPFIILLIVSTLTIVSGCSRSSGGAVESSTGNNETGQGGTASGCDAQAVVENSSTSIVEGDIGETALIDCNEGFQLNGETATLTCGNDGQWQGEGCVKSTLTLLRENLISTDSSGGLDLLLADRYFFEGGYYERYVEMEKKEGSLIRSYFLRKYDSGNNLNGSFADESATEELPGMRLIDIPSISEYFAKSPNGCMLTLESGEFLVMGSFITAGWDGLLVAAYNADGTLNTSKTVVGEGFVILDPDDLFVFPGDHIEPSNKFHGNSKSCIKLSENEFLFSGIFTEETVEGENSDFKVSIIKIVLDENGKFSFDTSFGVDGTVKTSISSSADFDGQDESWPELVLTTGNQFILKYEMEEPKGISFERYSSSGDLQGERVVYDNYTKTSGSAFRRGAVQQIYGLNDGRVLFSKVENFTISDGASSSTQYDSVKTVVFDPSTGGFSDVRVSIGEQQQDTDFLILDSQYFPSLGKQILLTYGIDSLPQIKLTYYVVDNDLEGTVDLTSGKKYTVEDFDDNGYFPLYSNIYYLNDIFNLDVLLYKGNESSGEEIEVKQRTYLFE